MKSRLSTLFALLVWCASISSSQTAFDNLYVTNGQVSAVVVSGNTIYIGGGFTSVGPNTGAGAVIDTATGIFDPSFPRVNGTISTVIPDGSGGWYIGGGFTAIGGTARNRIAHILSDKSLDPGWNPNANSDVYALALSGSTVYAGGNFTSIGGQTRNYIAALDASTGLATSWNPSANNYVRALAVSGSTVYAGGVFTTIGGQTRNYIAALDSVSPGLATSWNPSASNYVSALAVSGSTVFAGGAFNSIGGQTRNNIAALDSVSPGLATSWNPNANNTVYALALDFANARVYAGGDFKSVLNNAYGYFVGLTNPDPAAFPPAAPQNLAVTDSSSGRISIKWRKNTEADFLRYRIYRNTSPNPTTKVDSTSGGITDTTKTFLDVTNGTRYYLRVTAVDSSGNESGYSNEVNVSPADRIAPAAPQNLSAIAGSGQITLRWNKNSEPDFLRYRIYQGTSPTPTAKTDSTSSSVSDTTKTIVGLVSGRTYYFRVTAVDSAGNESGFSNEAGVVPIGMVGHYPFNGNANDESGNANNGTINGAVLATDRFGNANSAYQFNGTSAYIKASASNLPTATRTVSLWFKSNRVDNFPTVFGYGGDPCGASWFMVLNHGGSSTFMLTGHCSANTLQYSYSQPPVARWYHWVVETDAVGTRMFVNGSLVASNTNFISNTNVAGKDLAIGVAISATGIAPYVDSNVGYFDGILDDIRIYNRALGASEIDSLYRQGQWPAPAAPISLVVTDSSSRTITIKWRKNNEADFLRYRIYRATTAGPTTMVDSTAAGISDTSKTFTGLTNGTRYYFRISAVDSAGNESGYSNEVNAVPADRVAPAAPASLALTDSSSGKIGIKWRKNTDGDFLRYRIYRATSPNAATRVDSTAAGAGDTSKTFTGLTNGTRYYLRVTSVDSSGNESAYSNEVNGAPNAALAVEDLMNQIPKEYSLSQNYPNPFNPRTVIRYGLPARSIVKLEIYNMLGQSVALLADEEQDARFYERQWQARVSSGLYFYRLEAVSTEDPNKRFLQVRKMLLLK